MNYFKLSKQKDLSTYTPSEELKAASEMSLALGRPLLLSGKPGTGKTQFAHWLAAQDGFNPEPFVFNTKSTSIYTDLFYHYDAVSHFRSKDDKKKTSDFIELTALGKAIVTAKRERKFGSEVQSLVNKFDIMDAGKKNIVLIDEIDKAPRDFPNDLLYELENLSFTIKELSSEMISLNDEERKDITVILTSNFEKSLPDAFLRRCLFYHIPFPDKKALKQIIINKLEITKEREEALSDKLDKFFLFQASTSIQKKPGTDECIQWINWLNRKGILDTPISKSLDTLSILLKNETDLQEAIKILTTK